MDALPDLGPLPGPPLPPVDGLLRDPTAGDHALVAPVVDSDADGAPDTVVLAGAGPGADLLVLATDLDGDHHADVVTTVDAAGRAATVTVGDDRDGGWGGVPVAPPPPAPTIDPVTGAWTRAPGGP